SRRRASKYKTRARLAQAIEQLEGRMLLTLTGTVATPAADTNLTSEGTLDWAHFGFPDSPTGIHRKAGVTGTRISNFSPIGTPTVGIGDTTNKFSWTDAQPRFELAQDVT